MVYKRLILIVFLFLPFISCDREACKNQNPVFDRYSPDSEIYKEALARIILEKKPTDLRYWLKEYREEAGEEYLFFNVQGSELCAVMMIHMTHWDRLEKVREKKAVSYHGAEFTGLDYEIMVLNGKIEYVFKTYESIID